MAFQPPMGNPCCSKMHYMGFRPQDPWVLFRNMTMIFFLRTDALFKDRNTDRRKPEAVRAITHIEEEIGVVPLPGCLMQFRI